MCVTNKGVTRFACGHREETEQTEYCEDFVTFGECNDARTYYFGSNTGRGRVCSKCRPEAAEPASTSKSNNAKKDKKDDKEKDSSKDKGYPITLLCHG